MVDFFFRRFFLKFTTYININTLNAKDVIM